MTALATLEQPSLDPTIVRTGLTGEQINCAQAGTCTCECSHRSTGEGANRQTNVGRKTDHHSPCKVRTNGCQIYCSVGTPG